mgnify:CR=1 FL=1
MMSGYSAVSHGHAHPELLRVFHEQSSKLSLTSRAFYTDTLWPYLETITKISGFEMCLPMNSGAEAVETAIKSSRRWAYRTKKVKPGKAGYECFKACYEAGVNFKATGDCLIIAPQFICEEKHIDEIIDKLRTGITNYQKNQKN